MSLLRVLRMLRSSEKCGFADKSKSINGKCFLVYFSENIPGKYSFNTEQISFLLSESARSSDWDNAKKLDSTQCLWIELAGSVLRDNDLNAVRISVFKRTTIELYFRTAERNRKNPYKSSSFEWSLLFASSRLSYWERIAGWQINSKINLSVLLFYSAFNFITKVPTRKSK